MGLEVNSKYELPSGIVVDSFYASSGAETRVFKMGGKYRLTCMFNLYVSKEAKDAGKSYFDTVYIEVPDYDPSVHVWDVAYDELKKKFSV